MENISESKKKIGRPEKLMDCGRTYNEFIQDSKKHGLLNPENKSRRAHINGFYMSTAQGALQDSNGKCFADGEFAFIISHGESMYDSINYKRTILQELGRLEDYDTIRLVARYICENKLTTDSAVSYIRQLKVGQKQGSALELAIILSKTIEAYSLKHKNVECELVLSAISDIYDIVKENFS